MNNLGSVHSWVLDLTKEGKKPGKPFYIPMISAARVLPGSRAELVSMPTNEPSSLIVDSWLQTPIRAPSLQLCVRVYDFKYINVLFTCLQWAVSVCAWRIGLPSGCSNTFRCCSGSDEDCLCHEGQPGQGSVWFDLRLAEVGRVEAGKALSLTEDNAVGFASSVFTYPFQTSQGIWQ